MSKEESVSIKVFNMESMNQISFMEYHLFLVLRGHVQAQLNGKYLFMDENDLVLYSPEEKISFWGNHRNIILDVSISVPLMEKYIPVYEGKFICNSSIDDQHDYHPVRSLLSKLAMIQYSPEDNKVLYEKSIFYMLMYYLKTIHFEKNIAGIAKISPKYSDRVNDILDYIQKNYASVLNLEDIASHTNLSLSYVSRFFKQAFGDTFVSFLKKYRLERSMHDLCYSQKTVTEIGIEHGFSDANGYIRAFREIYGKTPKTYRDSFIRQQKLTSTCQKIHKITDNSQYALKLQELSSSNVCQWQLIDGHVPESRHYFIEADAAVTFVRPLWKSGINIASSKNIIYGDIVDEIKEMQKDIGFSYGRISFLMLDRFVFGNKLGQDQGNYNFFSFTQMINHLLASGLIPYLDLSFSPEQALGDKCPAISKHLFLDWLRQLILYGVNVFGKEEMEKWIFDIGITSHIFNNTKEDIKAFVSRYIQAVHIIKGILPKARVGGFNCVSFFMLDEAAEILKSVLKQGLCPDFISINIFPYVFSNTPGTGQPLSYSPDADYALKMVQKWKKRLSSCMGFGKNLPPVFINALGTTIVHRNYINDTCYQATFIVKNMISLLGEVDLICFYQMSDFNFSYAENQLLLNGRNGLFSQFRIHKPGYIAFQMMGRLTNSVIGKGKDYLVTRGIHDTYYILLCNHVPVSDRYCLKIDTNPSLAEAYTVYTNADDQNIRLTLNHVKDGQYRILSYHLSRENGSIFDEWEKTGFWNDPNLHELNYLRQAIHPKRSCSKRTSFNGQLNFHMSVKPFEVILIEASLII